MDVPGLPARLRFTLRRELASLEAQLEEGERVRAATDGALDGTNGLLAATSQRLLWVPSRGKVLAWDYGEVDGLGVEVGRDDATVTVRAGVEETLTGCDRDAARAVAKAVEEGAPRRSFRWVQLVDDPKDATPQATPAFRRRMETLERQLEKGALTDAEFRANRRRLLEESGLPTDLELGMPTKGPVLPLEPRQAPPAWPDRSKRPAKPMLGEPDWPEAKLQEPAPKAPKEWTGEQRAAGRKAADGKSEAPAWRDEPKRGKPPTKFSDWPEHRY
ncbi:MAG: hypothetical protein QOD77_1628 [Thermoplasmata archaeon]|jgi:hypothetical protein|nr:hypothetical protein [Thermoplasmata archaeon]